MRENEKADNQKQVRCPAPADLNGGAILYATRCWRGLSRRQVGIAIGVSAQQIEKYERGRSRMALSTIYALSRLLGVPPSLFFAGLDGAEGEAAQALAAFALTPPEIRLLRAYRAIPESFGRNHVTRLAEALAGIK